MSNVCKNCKIKECLYRSNRIVSCTFKNNKKSKYRNRKVVYRGIKFDSKLELKRYLVLKTLEKTKEIIDLELQPKYLLQDSFKDKDGKLHRAINYFADFRYQTLSGKIITEDVKSDITRRKRTYKNKIKMLLLKYPEINFVEVLNVSDTSFIK